MRYWLLFTTLLIGGTAGADTLWLQGAASNGPANGERAGASRSLGNLGLPGMSAGITHNRVADSWWTVVAAAGSRKMHDRLYIDGKLEFGPGQLDGENFNYRKLSVGATWLLSPKWTAGFSDTYINVDQAIGHVLSSTLTRHLGDYSVSLHGAGSIGSAIDHRQMGVSFSTRFEFPVIGGIYAGKTSNPTTLHQAGLDTGTNATAIRQAYAGISVPIGRYTLLGVLDYLRLDTMERHEFSLVLTVPLGQPRGAGR